MFLNDSGDFESGPFCIHWSDLGDCDDTCAVCGHGCNDHCGTGSCNVDGCECKEIKVGEV